MFCKFCGSELPDTAKFCGNCGKTVSVAVPAQDVAPAQDAVPAQDVISAQDVAPIDTVSSMDLESPSENIATDLPEMQPIPTIPPVQPIPGTPQQYSPIPADSTPKKKGGKRKPVIIAIACVLAVAILAGAFYFLYPLFGSKLEKKYNALCDLTTLSTESYMYARLLTEQLLETDVTIANPEEVDARITETIAAWEAVQEVTDEIDALASDLEEELEDKELEVGAANNVFDLTMTAYAADEEEEWAKEVGKAMDAEDTIESCAQLGSQLGTDAENCLEHILHLQDIYDGTNTSTGDWCDAADEINNAYCTVVFLSGELTSGDDTIAVNGAITMHTVSTDLKPNSVVVSDTNIVAAIGEDISVLIMGSGDTVTMSYEDIYDYLPLETTVMTIGSSLCEDGHHPVSFHDSDISEWFIIDRTANLVITRDDKQTNALVPPEIDGIQVESSGMTSNDIREELIDQDGTVPQSVHNTIDEWVQSTHIGSDDIIREVVAIVETVQPSSYVEENLPQPQDNGDGTTDTTVDEATLDEQLDGESANDGAITVSMLWGTYDDLDIHIITPDGSHIYYSNPIAGGGALDVDRQASSFNLVDAPVENIYFGNPESGHYQVYIMNYRDRTDSAQSDYLVRVTIGDETKTFDGKINETGTRKDIYEFDYESEDDVESSVVDEATLTEVLGAAEAGEGEITASMLWGTWDDLDLHIVTPTGAHIYYSNKVADGGSLDVDANASSNDLMTNPAENIYFPTPAAGHYRVYIKDYADRTEDEESEYLVRITIGGESQVFTGTITGTGTEVEILEFDYAGGAGDATAEGTTASIPSDAATFDGHRYALYTNSNSWSEAKRACEAMGGHLVTITSQEEQDFIESTFPGSLAWIGASGSGDSWSWITGEEFSYTNWRSGEPNNKNGNEVALHLFDEMQWNDLKDNDTGYHRGYICEWESEDGSYDAPTIDERLDQSGAMSGDITISLAWDNYDDLDLHVYTPDGSEIYYGHREAQGGQMDVDMQYEEIVEHPVENIYFAEPESGHYSVYIENYNDKTEGPTSYTVRVTIGGQSQTFTGTIDGSDTVIDITDFDYDAGSNTGNTAAAISETVLEEELANAGAESGEVTISVIWDSTDDLDLHVFTPDGSEIYYNNRTAQGGELDIDMNLVSDTASVNAVENVYFEEPEDGEYWVYIDNYEDRNPDQETHYLVQITVGGESETFEGTIDGTDTVIEVTGFDYEGH